MESLETRKKEGSDVRVEPAVARLKQSILDFLDHNKILIDTEQTGIEFSVTGAGDIIWLHVNRSKNTGQNSDRLLAQIMISTKGMDTKVVSELIFKTAIEWERKRKSH